MTPAWVALGSNRGDRVATLAAAVAALAGVPGTQVEAVSSLHESPAAGGAEAAAEPPFLNAVARLASPLAPRALLWHLLRIEAGLGRRRTRGTIGRPIDLDLLAVGDLVIQEPDLTLPHARLLERAFVVLPLLEIDPTWRHPATGRVPERPADAAGCRRVAARAGDSWSPLVGPADDAGENAGRGRA